MEIEKFLREADNGTYLMMKVMLIIGISGACRREELTFLDVKNITDKGPYIIIQIPDTKTNVRREFTISPGNFEEGNGQEREGMPKSPKVRKESSKREKEEGMTFEEGTNPFRKSSSTSRSPSRREEGNKSKKMDNEMKTIIREIRGDTREFLKNVVFMLNGAYPPRGCPQGLLLGEVGLQSLLDRRMEHSVIFLFKLFRGLQECPHVLGRISLRVPVGI
ncbi:hypothetical protein MTP99_014236 [Tenebrio molitor]|nr:hypothetical protein MTP99_014236 [Tenebrio molitor]